MQVLSSLVSVIVGTYIGGSYILYTYWYISAVSDGYFHTYHSIGLLYINFGYTIIQSTSYDCFYTNIITIMYSDILFIYFITLFTAKFTSSTILFLSLKLFSVYSLHNCIFQNSLEFWIIFYKVTNIVFRILRRTICLKHHGVEMILQLQTRYLPIYVCWCSGFHIVT